MGTLLRATRLRPVDWAFLARAGASAVVVDGLLRVASLPTTAQVCARRLSSLPVPEEPRLVALTDRLLRLDRGPLRANCVVRSLLLLRYLPPGAVTLKMGFRPGVRPIDGHAWLEDADGPVSEVTDPREHYVESWSWSP